MKHPKRYLLFLVLSSMYFTALKAQNTIAATGGNTTGSGGSVSYTTGQVAYNTFSGSNGTVAQGVQQPYEISIVTAIENVEGIALEYKVYPNPTIGLLKLIIRPFNDKNLGFRLYDLNGVLLQDKKIESEETEISLDSFYPSVYILKVIKDNKEVKVFKIVKK